MHVYDRLKSNHYESDEQYRLSIQRDKQYKQNYERKYGKPEEKLFTIPVLYGR